MCCTAALYTHVSVNIRPKSLLSSSLSVKGESARLPSVLASFACQLQHDARMRVLPPSILGPRQRNVRGTRVLATHNDEHRSSFPKWRGRAPVNLFEETHSVFKFESSPICGGMVPLISLFWKNLQRKQ